MNKLELAARVADTTGLQPDEALRAIEATLIAITESLARGEPVRLTGFGNFVAETRKASTGRNPRTGEPMDLAASVVPKFRVAQKLKVACKTVATPLA